MVISRAGKPGWPALTRMSPTARRQGMKNALICASGLALLCAALAVPVYILLRLSVAQSFHVAFWLAWPVLFLNFLPRWLHSRLSRGRILLDCGPLLGVRWLVVVVCIVLFLVAAGGGFKSGSSRLLSSVFAIPAGLLLSVWVISSGLFWLIMAFGRLQVTERGIWWYWGLLPWGKIGSYRWEDDSTLLIAPKRRFSLRGALPVPPEHKQAVDAFLAQFCGGSP
jgi:hypothetical protein